MIYNDGKAGFLTSIIGPMFSEKSGELIKRCLLAQKYQGKKVVVYKPALDNRYSEDEVVSRIGLRIMAHRLEQDLSQADLDAVYKICADADIVAFDEAQFFSHELVALVEKFVSDGKHVIVAGLNLDFLGKPFGHLDEILLFSDEIEMKSAFCACCGRPAMYTQRLVNGSPVTEGDLVLIGDTEAYEPRCRLCYVRKR